jgi:hypothetical protein
MRTRCFEISAGVGIAVDIDSRMLAQLIGVLLCPLG